MSTNPLQKLTEYDQSIWLDFTRRGDYLAIQAYLTEEPKTQELLQTLRTTLQQQLRLATTIGYGPRFLHSTGQFHKGGPNTGLFLQLTGGEPEELAVPGTGYTFGTFIRAQAEGDLEALRDEDRRIIRIDLNSKIHEGLKKLNEWLSRTNLTTVKK